MALPIHNNDLPQSPLLRENGTPYSPPIFRRENLIKVGIVFAGCMAVFIASFFVFVNYECIRFIRSDKNMSLPQKGLCGLVGFADLLTVIMAISGLSLLYLSRRIHRMNPNHEHHTISSKASDEIIGSKELQIKWLRECFSELKKQNILDLWMSVNHFTTVEEAILGYSDLDGFCFAHTMALTLLLAKNYSQSSANLIQNLRTEDIFYYQFLHTISVDLKMKLSEDRFLGFVKSIGGTEEKFKENGLDYVFHCMIQPILAKASIEMEFERSTFLDLDKLDETQLRTKLYFCEQALRSKVTYTDYSIVCGATIVSKKTEGHSIFVQLTDHFRFYDSGSPLKGFYEFSDRESLIKGLTKQILSWREHEYKSDALFRFVFFILPKNTYN